MAEPEPDFDRDLPIGWGRADAEMAQGLHTELQKELPPGHLMHGTPVSVVAFRGGTDDILCQHRNDPNRFTVIHLTWAMKREIGPDFPYVECDGNYETFLEYEQNFLNS